MADSGGDVFQLWRTMIQQWEQQANKTLIDVTGKDEFSRDMNRTMTTALTMQAAFHEAVEKALTTLNLPSRGELTRLGERLDNIERKLDALLSLQHRQAMADGLIQPPAGGPKRTRKPPEEAEKPS